MLESPVVQDYFGIEVSSQLTLPQLQVYIDPSKNLYALTLNLQPSMYATKLIAILAAFVVTTSAVYSERRTNQTASTTSHPAWHSTTTLVTSLKSVSSLTPVTSLTSVITATASATSAIQAVPPSVNSTALSGQSTSRGTASASTPVRNGTFAGNSTSTSSPTTSSAANATTSPFAMNNGAGSNLGNLQCSTLALLIVSALVLLF